ncbi:unnamed protein product [Somion occarium]|uniref:Uncharacterized protein n=1 Tax=Somion occarium TaxID=3059160 RepID=A0ABP1DXM7_9APHY
MRMVMTCTDWHAGRTGSVGSGSEESIKAETGSVSLFWEVGSARMGANGAGMSTVFKAHIWEKVHRMRSLKLKRTAWYGTRSDPPVQIAVPGCQVVGGVGRGWGEVSTDLSYLWDSKAYCHASKKAVMWWVSGGVIEVLVCTMVDQVRDCTR